jgi:hypothetical protein
MRLKHIVWATIAIGCVVDVVPVPLNAQSLAEVARDEQARRKQIKQPARVYTNKDLISVPPRESTSPTAASDDATERTKQSPAKDEKTEAVAADDTAKATPAQKDPLKVQELWSGRLKELNGRLDRDRVLADALQSRINALTSDFSARDDPVQRGLIASERQKALDELDRMRKSIANDQKAIADFQEEARRADVPAGWVR